MLLISRRHCRRFGRRCSAAALSLEEPVERGAFANLPYRRWSPGLLRIYAMPYADFSLTRRCCAADTP